jgi:hypothetical protein
MANFCLTRITFYGDPALIQRLFLNLEKSKKRVNFYHYLASLYEFDETREWGDIVSLYDIESFSKLNNNDTCFEIVVRNRWTPNIDLFCDICEYYDNKINFVYLAEESGVGLFVNTDKEGWFYTTRYYLDWYDVHNNNFESRCMELEKWEEVVKIIREAFPELDIDNDNTIVDINKDTDFNINYLNKEIRDIIEKRCRETPDEDDDECFFIIYKYQE